MNYISMDSSQDIIEHYGIKGMRWGIRSRHADLMDNHRSYKKMKKQLKSIQKDLIKGHVKNVILVIQNGVLNIRFNTLKSIIKLKKSVEPLKNCMRKMDVRLHLKFKNV